MAQKFKLENCKITFRNLGGRPTDFDRTGGKRTFAVILNPESAEQLSAVGFDVKQFINKETGEPGEYYLKVKVNFRYDDDGNLIAPHIYLINGTSKQELTPNTVSVVDRADIKFVDLTITPWAYTAAGRSGISAYCVNMYVNIEEDEFEKKYAMYDDHADENAEEIPFE